MRRPFSSSAGSAPRLRHPLLKGLAQLLAVYRVLYESMARSRLEAAGSAGLTPLVGREQEVGLLLERWAQVKDGLGQVQVLLSGEAGIGNRASPRCRQNRWPPSRRRG